MNSMERKCKRESGKGREREGREEGRGEREREREMYMTLYFLSWNFTVANMELSVIEGTEGSEFNCEVSPLFKNLKFKVDTLRGVLYAIDGLVMQPCSCLSRSNTHTAVLCLYLIQD